MIDLSFDVPDWELGGLDQPFIPVSGTVSGGITLPGGISVKPPEVSLPPITIGGGGEARQRAVAIVNAYEPVFRQNADAVRAGQISPEEGQRTFERLWGEMTARLSPLGAEGQRAIADRQPGGKFDWWAAYDRFAVTAGGVAGPGPGGPVVGPGPGPILVTPNMPAGGGLSLGGLALLGGLSWLVFRRRG